MQGGAIQGKTFYQVIREFPKMKICIVSDSHDRGPMLAAAIAAATAKGAEIAIHCGDVIGGNTLRQALKLGIPIHAVHGNNLGDPVAISRIAHQSGGLLTYHGQDAELELAGKRIFVTHYPHYAHAMACTGQYDLVCCGHSHEPEVRQQQHVAGGLAWVVNPGTVAGLGAPLATWILGDLLSMRFDVLPTPGTE